MKLKFKQQPYQADAAQKVVDCFSGQSKGTRQNLLGRNFDSEQSSFIEEIAFGNKPIELTNEQILSNIQDIQEAQGLKPCEKFLGMDLTIEMETGTGKTYVYIKTMYELNKHYGWSKFIVMVPSVAIREGVNKSFEITAEHFQAIYGKKIRFNIYDSKKKSNINNIKTFAESSSIEVIVMNYQAFAARSKDARKIYYELDEMQSRKPIDVLSAVKPILIIDEPHRFGKQANESIKNFDSLFRLRYSATHKKEEKYHQIYRLDSLDAFNKKLVKKIGVTGIEILNEGGTNSYLFLDRINVSNEKFPVAKIEVEKKQITGIKKTMILVSEGANLYELSGELEQYSGFVVNEINAHENFIKFTNGITLEIGQAHGDINEKHLRRIQIREAISSHLKKEQILFEKDIKVLSLFFIDEVAKYRQYDENNNQVNGEYAEMFEEEYINAINEKMSLFNPEYNDFLNNFEVNKIHNGYFSIDKKGKYVDSNEKKNEGGSDDVDAYNLIMKEKERLLSFEEPTRFIFSHSALREGWDNPNIFQICTLKHANSEISKRQEIGRGLRICVNKYGDRMDSDVLESNFFDINTLTIIASESYDQFAKDLQKEVLESLSDRPTKLTAKVLEGRVLKNEKGGKLEIKDFDADNLISDFKTKGYLNEKAEVTEKFVEDVEKGTFVLPEKYIEFKREIIEIISKIYSTSTLKIAEDGRKDHNIKFELTDNFYKQEFQNLWDKIKFKTAYEVDFDSKELIEKVIETTNSNLQVRKPIASITQGEQEEEEISVERIRDRGAISAYRRFSEKISDLLNHQIEYDLIEEIVRHTFLTRKSVVSILKGLTEKTFSQYQMNPEDFIRQISNFISNEKSTLLINCISYAKTGDTYTDDVFTINNLGGSLGQNIMEVKKHIYDYLKYDSDNEKFFAEALETGEISVYAKLPRDFKIPTPIGSYNPDWAIVFDKKDVRYIYFIAETKGSMNSLELREVEKQKINYAKKHFEALGGKDIKYGVIDTYESLLNEVMK